MKHSTKIDWANLFMEEFEKESDRASVILSVAMLDQALENILKARLLPIGTSEDNLLEGSYSPISTFSSRIDLAHRLGLISTKFCRDLHIIRRVRNNFSHNITGCSFDDASVCDQVNALICSSGVTKRNPKRRTKQYVEGSKGDFQMTISWMLWHLCGLLEYIESIKPTNEEFGYTYKEADK